MEDLPLGRIAALVPEFAVKDLPLGRTLMMTMGLFNDCHFLFEIQLMYLSLNIEVLALEESEWSRGR